MKKIGIIGSGMVAQVLGKGYLSLGHSVMLGTRDAGKLASWQQDAGANASVGSFAEAAAFGDVLILAVKGSVAEKALAACGAENLAGKAIMDATNPIADAPPVDGVLPFFTGPGESLMERLQEAYPEAYFVKAFNSVGNAMMVQPKYTEGQPTMFICGNNDQAREEVAALVKALGWDVADMGTARSARAIEPLCMLWCISGFRGNEWTHAFKVLHHS